MAKKDEEQLRRLLIKQMEESKNPIHPDDIRRSLSMKRAKFVSLFISLVCEGRVKEVEDGLYSIAS